VSRSLNDSEQAVCNGKTSPGLATSPPPSLDGTWSSGRACRYARGVSPDIGDPVGTFRASLRLLLGIRIGARVLQFAANRRSLDTWTAPDGLTRLADPAVILRIPGDLFVLTDVFALPESAALRRINAFAIFTSYGLPKYLLEGQGRYRRLR